MSQRVSWPPPNSTVDLVLSSEVPPVALITSAHILCFSESQLLMVRHEARGWDIPGGHIEPQESLESALSRELLEEAGARTSDMRPVAFFRIEISGEKPKSYPYPFPTSYIACFVGHLKELLEFSAHFETTERRLFLPEEVRHGEWYRRHSDLFEVALKECKTVKEGGAGGALSGPAQGV